MFGRVQSRLAAGRRQGYTRSLARPQIPTLGRRMHLAPGQTFADKYRIEGILGEGGMGTVYAAKNSMTGRAVALKCIRQDLYQDGVFSERFLREARVAGKLDHPNIVNVYDAGFHEGTLFLVMELLRGQSFESWLRSGERSPSACIAALMPALRGVAAAHSAGVIHRDLKPDNIFLCLDESGFVHQTKVLDFGIAKELDDAVDSSRQLTNPGTLMGTIHYMAPEQVRCARDLDLRCDIYALGVILYHALSGHFPFRSESLSALIIEIAEGNPAPLGSLRPNLPAGLAAIVMRAMSKQRDSRFDSVADLAYALEPYANGIRFSQHTTGETLASSASVVPNDAPEARRSFDWRLPVSIVVLLGMVAGWAVWSQPMEAEAGAVHNGTGAVSDSPPPADSPPRDGTDAHTQDPPASDIALKPAEQKPEPSASIERAAPKAPVVAAKPSPARSAPTKSASAKPAPATPTPSVGSPAAPPPSVSAQPAPSTSAPSKPAQSTPAHAKPAIQEDNPYLRH